MVAVWFTVSLFNNLARLRNALLMASLPLIKYKENGKKNYNCQESALIESISSLVLWLLENSKNKKQLGKKRKGNGSCCHLLIIS